MEIDIEKKIIEEIGTAIPADWDEMAIKALVLWQAEIYKKTQSLKRLMTKADLQLAVANCQKATKGNMDACLLFIKVCEKSFLISSERKIPVLTFRLDVMQWDLKSETKTGYLKSITKTVPAYTNLDELEIPNAYKKDYMNFCKRNPAGTVAQWFSYVNAATHRRKLCKDLAESGAITSKYFGKRMFDQAKRELSLLPEAERSQWCLESTETGQGEEIIENASKGIG